MADRRGLRKGTAARVRVTFVDGGKPVNWSGRSCTGKGRLDDGTAEFDLSISSVGVDADGKKDVLLSASQIPLSSTAKHVLLEFTITGLPVVNSPERPVKIPLRAPYSDGPDR